MPSDSTRRASLHVTLSAFRAWSNLANTIGATVESRTSMTQHQLPIFKMRYGLRTTSHMRHTPSPSTSRSSHVLLEASWIAVLTNAPLCQSIKLNHGQRLCGDFAQVLCRMVLLPW